MTVVVKSIGGSVAVVIPKSVAREAELTEGMSLEISATNNGIIMRKQGRRPRRPLSQIVAHLDPAAYRRRAAEMQGEGPVGKEIW